ICFCQQLIAQDKIDTLGVEKADKYSTFLYEDCVCATKVDLAIFNGLYKPYGGNEVANAKETSVGAVTVANKNDTDGDGTTDKDDNDVTATAAGRDEVDLMKLVISTKSAVVKDCPPVVLTTTGNIKLWEKSTKGTPASTIIPVSDLPKTLWIEATDVSNSVRDISIKATLDGIAQDEVKATAIWVEKKNVYKDRLPTPTPASLGIDEPTLLSLFTYSTAFITPFTSSDGTLYGFGSYYPIPNFTPQQDGMFGGRILFEFEIKPFGIEQELNNLGINYDITRRANENEYYLNENSSNVKHNHKPYPTQNEESNDDGLPSIDEDNIPKPMETEIFSVDAPGNSVILYPRSLYFRNFEAKEFVRVSFGQSIDGNGVVGSRCSDPIDWNLEYAVRRTNTLSSNDPYDATYIVLGQTNGGLIISNPVRLIGNGNGTINISNISNSNSFTYYFEFLPSSDQWQLKEKTTTGIINNIQTSNISQTGPWIINANSFTIEIINDGNIAFTPNTLFSINIWDMPTPSNTL
ncbi:MAG: hypothetical protein KDD49_14315, partial [Bacteroidetes bacterium]|nr:hypothetical protein [Bacteroidota bacterium]